MRCSSTILHRQPGHERDAYCRHDPLELTETTNAQRLACNIMTAGIGDSEKFNMLTNKVDNLVDSVHTLNILAIPSEVTLGECGSIPAAVDVTWNLI
jgi:hypothetical protein